MPVVLGQDPNRLQSNEDHVSIYDLVGSTDASSWNTSHPQYCHEEGMMIAIR